MELEIFFDLKTDNYDIQIFTKFFRETSEK